MMWSGRVPEGLREGLRESLGLGIRSIGGRLADSNNIIIIKVRDDAGGGEKQQAKNLYHDIKFWEGDFVGAHG